MTQTTTEGTMMDIDATDPTEAAGGADTLLGVLDEVAAEGYETQQIARRGGVIECTGCGQELQPERFSPERVRRLEGASDAADELMIVASPCPSCSRRGVLILNYGPTASSIDADVTAALDLSGADPSAGTTDTTPR